MADFTALKTAIQNAIKQNGNEEITGNLLQDVLLAIVTTLGEGNINDLIAALNAESSARQLGDSTLQGGINTVTSAVTAINYAIANGCVYAGIATPTGTPATGRVFYLALTAGTYTNYGNKVVTQGINILKYNGSAWSLDVIASIDDAPTPSSNNLIKSGGAFDFVMKNNSAFDLSAYNNGTTYADLNAALTALNALPAAYKRGGMSFRFVLISDNKYVQYRCMAQNFTTDTTQWQSVDDEPTAGSKNLVESGGAFLDINREINTINLTGKYWGYYCSNINTGAISQANGTYNGFLIKVVSGAKYKIDGSFANQFACYSGVPSTETFIEKLSSSVITVPSEGKYIVMTVALANLSEEYKVSRLNYIDNTKIEYQKNFVTCTSVGTTALKIVQIDSVFPTKLYIKFQNANIADNVQLKITSVGKTDIQKQLYYCGKQADSVNCWENNNILEVIYNEADDRFDAFPYNRASIEYLKGNSWSLEGVTTDPSINVIVRGLHLLESDKATLNMSTLYVRNIIINNSKNHRITVSDGTNTLTIQKTTTANYSAGEFCKIVDSDGRYVILYVQSSGTFTKSYLQNNHVNEIVFTDFFEGMLDTILPDRYGAQSIPVSSLIDKSIGNEKLKDDVVEQQIENTYGTRPSIYGLSGADATKVTFVNNIVKEIKVINIPEDYTKGCVRLLQVRCDSASSSSVKLRFRLGMIVSGALKYAETQYVTATSTSTGTFDIVYEKFIMTVDNVAVFNCGLAGDTNYITANTVDSPYAVYPSNDYIYIDGKYIKPSSVTPDRLSGDILKPLETNKGFLYGKKVVTLCDSMGDHSQWQSLLAQLTGAEYNKSLNDYHYSFGGTKTFNVNSNGNDGQSRAKMLVDEALIIPDVIIYENVNDTEGLTTGSSDDEPFFRTKQEELNITSQESQQAAKDYWDNNFATIVGGKIPQIGTILGVPFTSNNGVKVTIGNTPSASGNITFSISGAGTKSISVEAGESIASIIAKIIEYDWNLYIDEVDPQDANSVIFTKTDGTTPSSFVIDAGSTGVSITKTENVSGTLYVWKIFRGHDISKWTNSDYWVESITRWAMWKGVIEYLQTNFPQALIYWLLPSTWDFNTSILPADAFYPDGSLNVKYILANKQTYHFESEIDFCELYQIPIIDLRNEAGINPINASTYCNAGNVHPKQLAYNRWAEIIAQQLN